MKRLVQTMGYLIKSIVKPTLLALAVMIFMLAIIDFTMIRTSRLSSNEPLTMPLEFVSGGLSILIGAAIFLTNFRVSLANGISRKTFMLANLIVAMLIAAFFTVATLAMTKLHALFWPINTFSVATMIENPQLNHAWPLFFQLTLYLFLILTGRLMTMIYYRSNKWGKGILSLAPFLVFIPILRAVNGNHGEFYRVAVSLFLWILQPEHIIGFLISGALVMLALTWLVIYRAPLKD